MINKKLPITIIIITNQNDTRFINALKSSQMAREIIVVDNNSNNNWNKLRKEFEFKIIKYSQPINNFSTVRNMALSKVKTNWVFFLDSDETLGNCAEELNRNFKIIANIIKNNDDLAGVIITRKDIFLGKTLNFGEVRNTKIIRMFKIKKGKYYGNVHETVKVSGKIKISKITISHFSHTSTTDFFKAITKYSKLAAKTEKPYPLGILPKMIFYPLAKFIFNFFYKLGFIDGYRGLVYATMMSLHSFFVRVFYYEKYLKITNKK